MEKERADVLVVQQGLCDSRERAKRLIMAGKIYDDNNLRIDKPGEKIDRNRTLHIKGETMPYVSRGGLKLEKALRYFEIDVSNKTILDIGASTGGFTDVALQNGARMSYALDVGYNQLHWKLRQDDRVIVMERMNFRYAQPADFEYGVPEFVTIDVSFISLRLILPNLTNIIADRGEVVALIKPQFEAGRDKVGKKGIIKERSVHKEVIEDILNFAMQTGYSVKHLTFSPITGGSGNIEFLVHLQYTPNDVTTIDWTLIDDVLEEAHQQLQ